MIAILFTCAQPLTEYVLGKKWLDGVILLRLESVTALLGLVLTTVVPLLFLIAPARRIKWIMIGWTTAVLILSPPLALIASYKAISVAQILAATVVLATIERMLRVRRSYSLVGDMRPGLVGLLVAIAIGFPLASTADGAVETLFIAASVGCVQLAVAVALGGGVDPRDMLRRIGGVASGDALRPPA
jgi:O-antigen/teichoic acid export membrane protein